MRSIAGDFMGALEFAAAGAPEETLLRSRGKGTRIVGCEILSCVIRGCPRRRSASDRTTRMDSALNWLSALSSLPVSNVTSRREMVGPGHKLMVVTPPRPRRYPVWASSRDCTAPAKKFTGIPNTTKSAAKTSKPAIAIWYHFILNFMDPTVDASGQFADQTCDYRAVKHRTAVSDVRCI